MKCNLPFEEFFFGTATVGERGQVVIPSEARKKFNISPGDKVLVMGHPTGNGVLLCKADALREVFSTFLEHLTMIESTVAESVIESHHDE